jgi:retron-type reverse transcriptase
MGVIARRFLPKQSLDFKRIASLRNARNDGCKITLNDYIHDPKMKTYKNLFSQIFAFDNLYRAATQAAKGKREKFGVMEFFLNLEANLFQLQNELSFGDYRPGAYRSFFIYDPKPRLISAAPFRDRVVHHALMNVIEPILERGLIFDTYANRIGKGTHKAIRRFQQYLQQYRFVLKCDIKKYFPSIDHLILKSLIRELIGDPLVLWLTDVVIDHSNQQVEVLDYFPGDDLFTPLERRKGLPIGNLTSQNFANYFLSPMDHFVKEVLKCRAYLRYVDDSALFSNDKRQLWRWLDEIIRFLAAFRLKLNLDHCMIFPSSVGERFLGQVVFPTHRRLTGENARKFKSRLGKWRDHPPENVKQRVASWLGHARQADTKALIRSLEKQFAIGSTT